jgi:two-component system, chemotaxis family, protein-glutamate methylesterase/glutaminase
VRFKLVVIGTSLGGLRALEVLLPGLPPTFPLPVAIAQHRHRDSDKILSLILQRHCALPVLEAEDKQTIAPGQVYLAPANYHLLIEAAADGTSQGHFALSTDTPVSHARPSIDVLFESAANTYAEGTIGVILTGASNDGAQGLATIKAYGGVAIVQDPQTAECSIMPKAALTQFAQQAVTAQEDAMAGVEVDWVLPLGAIAPTLVRLCQSLGR